MIKSENLMRESNFEKERIKKAEKKRIIRVKKNPAER
jgi:hypothetical protein